LYCFTAIAVFVAVELVVFVTLYETRHFYIALLLAKAFITAGSNIYVMPLWQYCKTLNLAALNLAVRSAKLFWRP